MQKEIYKINSANNLNKSYLVKFTHEDYKNKYTAEEKTKIRNKNIRINKSNNDDETLLQSRRIKAKTSNNL